MPAGPGRYRMTPSGVRLHFTPGGEVNEAKNMTTGKTHTPAEFARDRRRPKKRGAGARVMGRD